MEAYIDRIPQLEDKYVRAWVNACAYGGMQGLHRPAHPLPNHPTHHHAARRFDLYVEVKLWQKAAETAFRLKDGGRLRQVQASCGLPQLQRAIDDLLAKV